MVEVDRSRVPAVVDVAAACLAAEQLQKRHQIGVVHLCQDLHLRLGPTVDKEKQEKKRLRNHPSPHLLIPPGKISFFGKKLPILIFCFLQITSVHLLPLFPSLPLLIQTWPYIGSKLTKQSSGWRLPGPLCLN